MIPSSNMEQKNLSMRCRVGLAFLACLQNALVGGLILGWANIDKTLLGGAPEQGGAGLSLAETTKIFSWASAVSLAAALVLGAVLDRLGPRICSVAGQVSIAAGVFLFAAAGSFQAYALAACLIAFGGPGIQVSIVHVANLFPQNQYLVLCGLNGCISLSIAVFAVFDWLHANFPNLSVHVLFGSYVPVVLVSLVASLLLWPDEPYEPPEAEAHSLTWEPSSEALFVEATVAHQHLLEQPLDSYLRAKSNPRFSRSKSFIISDKAIRRGERRLISLKDQPFLSQLTSGTYIRYVFFFLVACFLANFFIASFSTEMADFQAFSPEEQHHLTQILAIVMSSGVAISFLVGYLMDNVGQVVCITLTILLGQLQLITLVLLGDIKEWLIVSFVLYVLFRQFLFPVFIAGVTDRLGFKYFGLLSGICFALSGVSQIFMASLVLAVEGDCHRMVSFNTENPASDCSSGFWKQLHGVEIALLTALLLAPFFEHLDRKQRDEQVTEVLLDSPLQFRYGSIQMKDDIHVEV